MWSILNDTGLFQGSRLKKRINNFIFPKFIQIKLIQRTNIIIYNNIKIIMNTLRASLLSGATTNRPLLHNYSQQQSRDKIPDRVIEAVTDKSYPQFKSKILY